MVSTGVIREGHITAAHHEADLDVDAVSGFSDKVRHHQPVVGVGSQRQVADRIDTVDVPVRSCVTRFPPLPDT